MFSLSRRQMMHRAALLGVATAVTHSSLDTKAAQSTPTTNVDDIIALIEVEDGVVRFDVAENATNYAWAGDPEMTEGMPTLRTAFATQGYIYPENTLTDSNGVEADGSPEFPDKVLGQWSCWGWYLGASAPAGPARWLTSHLVNFGATSGETTMVSEGFSIDEMEVALERAIVGGTGRYVGAHGVQLERNLGFNATKGINIRYEYRLASS